MPTKNGTDYNKIGVILGCIGLLFGVIGILTFPFLGIFFTIIFGILAIIFGAIAKGKGSKKNEALFLGFINIIMCVIIVFFMIQLINIYLF